VIFVAGSACICGFGCCGVGSSRRRAPQAGVAALQGAHLPLGDPVRGQVPARGSSAARSARGGGGPRARRGSPCSASFRAQAGGRGSAPRGAHPQAAPLLRLARRRNHRGLRPHRPRLQGALIVSAAEATRLIFAKEDFRSPTC